MDEDEKVEISLTVVKSKIPSPGGIARVNTEILPDICSGEDACAEKGDEIEVRAGDNVILVKMTADPLIEKDRISLREPDMEKLEVEAGDIVQISAYESITGKLGDLAHKVIDKLKWRKEEEEEE